MQREYLLRKRKGQGRRRRRKRKRKRKRKRRRRRRKEGLPGSDRIEIAAEKGYLLYPASSQ
jgi:transposase